VVTPTGHVYRGLHGASDDVVVISVIRAGDSMLDVILQILPNASVGKILIQRDEETAKPKLFYHKMPDLTNK
jgi:uracil phosphoribosyltransferase